MPVSTIPPALRFIADYRRLLHEIGVEAFVDDYRRGAVLIGMGMCGELPDRRPGWQRRTLRCAPSGELIALPSIAERVWPVRKNPRAKMSVYVTVGQSIDNDVVIGEYTVSTKHCAFAFDGHRVNVIDCASLNGTRVGERLALPNTATPLLDGALLTLGRVRLRVLYGPSFVRLIGRAAASAA
jgi:hypothetical protein